jgi:hypothetical protein
MLNTGTASYHIALSTPPGIIGFAPKISLTYEGGGGNGILGYGWSLPMTYVQRRTDRGIPTYGADVGFPREDTFINEMKEELVAVEGGDFFCQNEGAFIRYRQIGDHWEGTLPNGTRLEFGMSVEARIQDGADTNRVFCWLLERMIDTHGNTILYRYAHWDRDTDRNQKYLAEIRYGPGAPPWSDFHFVSFRYEERPDWFEDGRPGFLVRTGHRLTRIDTGTQGPTLAGHQQGDHNQDGISDNLNRRCELAYVPYAGAQSHWSLLARVEVIGADGITRLPPATLGYALCNPASEISAEQSIIPGENEPTTVMDSETTDLVDVDGDGLPDVLKTQSSGGFHIAYRNRGESGSGATRHVAWNDGEAFPAEDGAAWNFALSQSTTHLADMDGDGLADLVHKSALSDVFYFPNRGRAGWGARQAMSLEERSPPAPFGESGVRTADLDFNKRIDVIQSVSVGGSIDYRIWFNRGNQSYTRGILVPQISGFSLESSTTQVADMNGDRVPDLARIGLLGVSVMAGLGYGQFASVQFMALPDALLNEGQRDHAKLTDVNGDGLSDLVLERAAPGELWYWLNLGNYTFDPLRKLTQMPASIGSRAVVRWADLNGNGSVDLIYADQESLPRLQSVDLGELLTCGGIPNVLTAISNGIGRVTLISYAPSTKYSLADAAAGRPWPKSLPFPVTVVAGITNLDSLGHEYRTEFRYHDGYYDPEEKQFRGFGRAEQIEVGDPTAPTLVTRSEFATGIQFKSMKGKLLKVTTETEQGLVFTEETTLWTQPPVRLYEGTDNRAVHYAHPTGTLKLIKELGQGLERGWKPRRTTTPLGTSSAMPTTASWKMETDRPSTTSGLSPQITPSTPTPGSSTFPCARRSKMKTARSFLGRSATMMILCSPPRTRGPYRGATKRCGWTGQIRRINSR